MDTDGIYFQPPAKAGEPAAFEARIQTALPPGIEVELDAAPVGQALEQEEVGNLLVGNGRGNAGLEVAPGGLALRGIRAREAGDAAAQGSTAVASPWSPKRSDASRRPRERARGPFPAR
jgi:hypothetical protein